MKIKIGSWVAYTEDGLWVSPFDETRIAYDRKRDLVSDIGVARLCLVCIRRFLQDLKLSDQCVRFFRCHCIRIQLSPEFREQRSQFH